MRPNDPIQLNSDLIDNLSAVLCDDLDGADSDMRGPISNIKDWRRQLKAEQIREDKPYDGACELVPPVVKESLLAIIAEISPALLDVKPFLHFEPADLYGDYSEPWEAFHQVMLFEQMRARQVYEWWFYGGLRDGHSILMHTWDTVQRTVPAWQYTLTEDADPETGQVIARRASRGKRIEQVLPVYDYPRLTLVPPENFLCYPAYDADVQESEGVAARFRVTTNDLKNGVRLGDYSDAAVERVLGYSSDHPELTTPEGDQYGIGDNPNIRPNDHRNVMQLTECYWRLPAEDTKAPWADWLITIHEPSGVILRAIPQPYWHGQRPFVVCRPYATTPGLFGDSVASSGAGHVQDAKTTLFRYAVDATAFGVNPRQYADVALYNKMRESIEENNRPGGIIPMPSQYFLNGGRQLAQVPIGLSPQAILPILEALDIEAQKTTGASDSMKGQAAPNKITATEAAQIAESSKKIIGYLLEHCATATSESGQQVHDLVRQFADHESVATLWQRVNGQKDAPFEMACMGEYTVTANGISETSNKAILAQRAMERFTVLSNEPYVMGNAAKRWKLEHDLLRDTGTRNPEDYLGTQEEWIQQEAMEAQAQMAAMQQQADMQAQEQANAEAERASSEDQRDFDNNLRAAQLAQAGQATGGA